MRLTQRGLSECPVGVQQLALKGLRAYLPGRAPVWPSGKALGW